jgi:replicative DNA helicase
VDESEQKIFNIGEQGKRNNQGFQAMDSLVVKLLDRVQEMADNPNDVTGVPTGFYDLDRMTAGLQAGDLIVLAARPSMGKTALAINIAEHVALNEGLPVAVFSMEMGAAQLAVRIVGSIGRIDQGHLRTGRLTDDEWPRLSEAIEKLRTISLHIDESAGLTSSELRANARRLARQCGQLGLIVVDYLQLMSGSGGDGENRATELGEISRGLKMLARELKCPVIALSQLNRSVEQRPDKRPMMSDLRESGAIEQDADIIMFIYRDEYYTKDACKEPGVAEVIIAKQRNGPTGTVKLAFIKPITKFESLASGGGGDY